MVTIVRGEDRTSAGMFSYVRLEKRVPRDHPLRAIRALVDAALVELSPAFVEHYSRVGRPSVPPERLLRALLLQAFYTIRSELLLMEQLDHNLLFRWCHQHDQAQADRGDPMMLGFKGFSDW
jgi:transposase